jgi:hypothetical protein
MTKRKPRNAHGEGRKRDKERAVARARKQAQVRKRRSRLVKVLSQAIDKEASTVRKQRYHSGRIRLTAVHNQPLVKKATAPNSSYLKTWRIVKKCGLQKRVKEGSRPKPSFRLKNEEDKRTPRAR